MFPAYIQSYLQSTKIQAFVKQNLCAKANYTIFYYLNEKNPFLSLLGLLWESTLQVIRIEV